MEGYKFPLQKLLDMRIDKEDESKRNFMEAERQKAVVEQKLDTLNENYKRFNIEKVGCTIIERKIKDNYLNALKKNINETKQDLDKRIENVEIKRTDLMQKQVERKTVEKLKEKRLEAFVKEIEDKERRINDEFALYSYMRKFERR